MSKASLELGGTNWAAKDGNLLGYANGSFVDRYVPREFTFSRGSNLAATRVNASGLIEKGRENLLTYSNGFNSWGQTGVSVTSGQSGYDGSSDAWLLTTSAVAGYINRAVVNSGVQTYSIYAKAGTETGLFIRLNGGSNPRCFFDLTNGLVGSDAGGVIKPSIEDVGGGWYRCSIACNDTSTDARVYVAGSGDSFPSTGNIYIQDAQLEVGLAATDYIESGATTATAGLLENEPRIDYTDGTPSLLLEPQRTNLMIHSEYLSGLSLSGNPPIITQNYAVSPEGVQNAVRVQDTDATNFKIIQTQFSITAGSTYTISVYVKKATSPISTYGGFYFDFDGGTRKTSNLIFDEYNGTLVNATGNAITSVIHPVIDEGDYWRFSATATDTGSNSLLRPTLRAGASANGTSLSLVTKDYTAYGFQCEQGSYPTSYIPTYGTSVTRNGDFCTKTDATSLIGQTEGTIFLDLNVTTIDSSSFLFGIYGGSPRNEIYFRGQANNSIGFVHYNVNTQAYIVTSSLSEGRHKLAACYKNNDWVLYLDGTLVAGDTSGSFTGGANNISFGYSSSGVYEPYESVNQVLVFKTRLSNDELAALTTL